MLWQAHPIAGWGGTGWGCRDTNSSVKNFSASITTPEDPSCFAYKTGCSTSAFPCEHPHHLSLRS